MDYETANKIFKLTDGGIAWNVSPRIGIKPGEDAGCVDGDGYVAVRYKGRIYMAHRLVWLLATGALPTKMIDHINGLKTDNRIENLRDVSASVNQQNKTTLHKNNQSGFHGVQKNGGRFVARIKVSGKHIYLGSFADGASAHAAYIDAKKNLHPGYASAK